MSSPKPKIIIIAGPTASGKTEIGIQLAERFRGEIVSADSIQVYRFMDIGSAKPTPEERTRAPHHMIDVRNPDESFTAGDYVREARECITKIVARERVPLVVGGTGLYIKCLLGGIVEVPPANLDLRRRLLAEEDTLGSGTLFSRLSMVDPVSAARIGPQNLPRIMRGLEIFELTGRPMTELGGGARVSGSAVRPTIYLSRD